MTALSIIATMLVVAVGAAPKFAFAQGVLPESGFGQASKDLATSEPAAEGEHASSFAGESREGIGNVAKDFDLSVGELGCFLGGLTC